ncbi:MAG: tetratricopeptide repeat protein [Elusimicrobia bacterium]|nr:tetratricopeptide repeat protein [Elusimicrobiota bacterium]
MAIINESSREDIKRNEVADIVERVAAWIRLRPQQALWSAIGVVAAALLVAGFFVRRSQTREQSWTAFSAATAYAYNGQADAALNQVKALTEAYPSSSAAGYARLLAGDVLYEEGQYKKAEQAYQSAVDLPGNPAAEPLALSGLALSQEAAGECASAEATAQRFLDAHQDHFLAPQTHAVLARCLLADGKTAEAKTAFERIQVLYPNTYWETWAKSHGGN